MRYGETLYPNSPLIREQFNTADSFKVKHPKPVSWQTIFKILREKFMQSGIGTIEHAEKGVPTVKMRKDVPLIHSFRKFFNTALMNADVHPNFKLLMGHSIQLDEVYYDKGSDKSRAKLLEEYSKAIDSLTINEENRLRKKVEELTVEKSQMQQLKSEIDEIRQ